MKISLSSLATIGWRECSLLAALAVISFISHEWLAARDAVAKAQATLAAQSQLIAQQKQQSAALASAVHKRDAATQAQIAAMQKQVAQLKTAAQIADWLPKQLPLPQPIAIKFPRASAREKTIVAAQPAPVTSAPTPSKSPAAAPPNALASIPQADFPALRDYVAACKTCQLKLAAAQQDLAAKNQQLRLAGEQISAVQRQRDAALRAAKGGSFWNRLRHDAKLIFFVSLGAAGAICASGHCK